VLSECLGASNLTRPPKPLRIKKGMAVAVSAIQVAHPASCRAQLPSFLCPLRHVIGVGSRERRLRNAAHQCSRIAVSVGSILLGEGVGHFSWPRVHSITLSHLFVAVLQG
jgi:hypothetical protein